MIPLVNSQLHSSEIKRIIILGHTGFIGSHLIVFFRKQSPEIEIIGKSLPELNLINLEEVMSLAGLFDLKTAVIMCSGIKKQLGDNLEIFSQNIKMAENICHLLKGHPVRRFVYFSSAEVYGENSSIIKEDTTVNPVSCYGIAKYVSERLLRKFIPTKSAGSLLILRPPLIYGPGDVCRGYGPSGFVWNAINKKEIRLWGDGGEYREFIFIGNLIKIVFYLTFNEYDGVINIANGKSRTFKEALDIVVGLIPHKLATGFNARTNLKVDQRFCNELLIKLLPGFSFTSLEDGIKYTLEDESKKLSNMVPDEYLPSL